MLEPRASCGTITTHTSGGTSCSPALGVPPPLASLGASGLSLLARTGARRCSPSGSGRRSHRVTDLGTVAATPDRGTAVPRVQDGEPPPPPPQPPAGGLPPRALLGNRHRRTRLGGRRRSWIMVGRQKLNLSSLVRLTTGIWAFAECRPVCRVLFIGHSAKPTLPRVALGKVLHSVKILFTEWRTLGTAKHSAKTTLPRVKHSAKMALGKGPLAAVYSWRLSVFAECQILGTRQRTLCRVSSLDTRQSIFLFFYFVSQTFCGMFLHYVDLYLSFVDNYNRVFNR
jgi:hypothetical protein